MAKQVVAVALNDYVDKYSLCISLCLLVSFVWSLSHQFKRPETLLASTIFQTVCILPSTVGLQFPDKKGKAIQQGKQLSSSVQLWDAKPLQPQLHLLSLHKVDIFWWLSTTACHHSTFLSYIIVEMQCFFVCLFFVCL